LQTSVSTWSLRTQDLPTPSTAVLVRTETPPPQDQLHALHSDQGAPRCLQSPRHTLLPLDEPGLHIKSGPEETKTLDPPIQLSTLTKRLFSLVNTGGLKNMSVPPQRLIAHQVLPLSSLMLIPEIGFFMLMAWNFSAWPSLFLQVLILKLARTNSSGHSTTWAFII